jgi:hypothetical protein
MPSGGGATAAKSALVVVTAVTVIGIGYIHRTQRLEREVIALCHHFTTPCRRRPKPFFCLQEVCEMV